MQVSAKKPSSCQSSLFSLVDNGLLIVLAATSLGDLAFSCKCLNVAGTDWRDHPTTERSVIDGFAIPDTQEDARLKQCDCFTHPACVFFNAPEDCYEPVLAARASGASLACDTLVNSLVELGLNVVYVPRLSLDPVSLPCHVHALWKGFNIRKSVKNKGRFSAGPKNHKDTNGARTQHKQKLLLTAV